MHRHATGICGDVLHNIGIIEHSLASQLLGKVGFCRVTLRKNKTHIIAQIQHTC